MAEALTGCWLWTAFTDQAGYARINVGGAIAYAHRVSYELHVGPIPLTLVLDHKCRNRCCVNPDHLEPVSHQTNILRGTGATSRHARKTHCAVGHVLTERSGVRARWCRICANTKRRANYARRTKDV